MEVWKEVEKLNAIVEKDYDHEQPDIPRSKEFGDTFARFMKKMFADCYVKNISSYCEGGVVVKNPVGKYIYIRTDDYRWRDWSKRILYRTMSHAEDWTGGGNNFADIDELKDSVYGLFSRMK